jgi:catechol 2,3-dioxygenase-like lactoylglutathione lyase family enzyme
MANDAILLDHLALAVRDVREVLPFLVGELGGREDLAGPGMGFRFWQWAFAGGGRIEIMQPEGPTDGFLYRFLDARGPGPHHLTFKVPDLHDAAKRSGELGYDVVGLDTSQPAWMEAFLHPKQAQGIVVQLVESHPELGELDQGDWPFPTAPAERPTAITLLGVRLSAHSERRARLQWEELLGGSCQTHGPELVFRWPESPLRLVVQVDPGSPEGPRAVEITADRTVPLPEGPHPVLGVPFVAVGR